MKLRLPDGSLSVALACAALAGLAARVLGIFNDFWLDEIWSYNLVRDSSSWWDLLVVSRDENAHPLNSLFLLILGSGRPWWMYRVPSLAAGVLTLAVAAIAARRSKPVEGAALFTFFALSYLMVVYGSEARGYSFMILFLLWAWVLLQDIVLSGRVDRAPFFMLAAGLGVLSHFGFIQFYLAALLWSAAVKFWREPFRSALRGITRLHALPCLAVGLVYLFRIREMNKGTGNVYSIWDLLVNTVCISFNAPAVSPFTPIMNLALVFLAVWILVLFFREIHALFREGDARWLMYVLGIFLVPLGLVVVLQRESLEPRYFLPSICLGYFLAAGMLQRLRERGGLLPSVLLISLFVAGGAFYLFDFLSYGRGQYLDALQYIARASVKEGRASPVTIRGDSDFRTREVLDFYRKYAEGEYVYIERTNPRCAEWYLKQAQDTRFVPKPRIDIGACSYLLDKTFPYAGVSGWSWYLYRRV